MRLAAGAAAAVLALSLGAAPAQAQSSEINLSSGNPAYEVAQSALVPLSQDPAGEEHLMRFFATFRDFTPWGGFPLWNLWGSQTPYTPDKERDFAAPCLVKREEDARFDVERLYIESPAMRRVVQVQVQYPKDRTRPAPMLYLLDGVSAPAQSGWLRKGDVQGALANEHVTAIMPVEAGGTNYADWDATDPYLGRSKWETFLTQELPGVLESPEAKIAFNGERYIGGLSMGGSAAARIANLHPQLYTGAFSVSGCYSTTSTAGRQLFNLAIRSMGGNQDLMWGAGTSASRQRADITAHPEGLASLKRVYVYTADGGATPEDVSRGRGDSASTFLGNIVLEKLAHRCTTELEQSLDARGLKGGHITFDYHSGGVHDWPYYKRQLPVAWANVSGGQYTYR